MKVFGEESCPDYLVEIGQKIAISCRGLPLSIVVVGGLLSIDKTVGYWETISISMNSLLAAEGNQCSMILSLSFNHLPAHLKPCFLYFAVFPEDYNMKRSKLIRLWVAEGFLKPEKSNSLEDIAERYLEDLVNRSLIMVDRLGNGGKVKIYRIHDLLREICIIEVQKENFLHVTNSYDPFHHKGIQNDLHVRSYPNIPSEEYIYNSNGPTSLARSLQCFHVDINLSISYIVGFRLLWRLDIAKIQLSEFPLEVVRLIHLRYMSLRCHKVIVPALISTIWNLQTLIIDGVFYHSFYLPLAIWNMQHLRHVQVHECILPDPSITNFVAMVNLQTLSMIRNFTFTEEIIKRIPKLKTLKVSYDVVVERWPLYHLSNIVCLNELETLHIYSYYNKMAFPPNFRFPTALKKLTLSGVLIPWKDMTIVGSSPNVEVLILNYNACEGEVWEPNEGEFCELKFSRLRSLDLVQWRADDSHFPKLKCLEIFSCLHLDEIPIEIGNIATLEMIKLDYSSSSAGTSAKLILEEQQSFVPSDLLSSQPNILPH